MRTAIYLANNDGRLASIAEIAHAYDISQNHLIKVVQQLASAGFIETVRGRGGGQRLARPADQINVGALVRATESGFDLVDSSSCPAAPGCGLPRMLAEPMRAFLAVLDGYCVAGISRQPDVLRHLFAEVS